MSLRDGTKKMSKSDASDYSRINLTDDADTIAQKIRKAKTDPEPLPSEEEGLEPRPEADNLVGIYAALADTAEGRGAASEFGGAQFSAFKAALVDLAVAKLGADRRRDEAADRRTRPISMASWPTAPSARAGHRGRNHEGRQGHRRLRPALTSSRCDLSRMRAACRRPRGCRASIDRMRRRR